MRLYLNNIYCKLIIYQQNQKNQRIFQRCQRYFLINKSSNYSTQKTRNQSSPQSTGQYCLSLVKQFDYENYLCALLIKGNGQRKSAIAVRAFNVEVSKIASSVSDDKIGLMRLKFWQNAIDQIYFVNESDELINKKNTVPEHPVIWELKKAIDEYRLPKMYFTRLIKARERPTNLCFNTVKELEAYAEESTSLILYLFAKIFKIENMDVDHALSHLGKAQGILNLLRAQRTQSRQMAICIPQDVLLKHGVSHERVLRDQPNDKGVQDCTFEVASSAYSHLEKARNLSKNVPLNVKHLLLPAIAIERYLERLRKVDFHLSHESLIKRDSMLPMAYYWNYFKRTY